jgi:preprotein translocase subunit YajC
VPEQNQPTPSLDVGHLVITPSGLEAKVLEVYDGIGEVLIEWTESGERSQFRIGVLKPKPRAKG